MREGGVGVLGGWGLLALLTILVLGVKDWLASLSPVSVRGYVMISGGACLVKDIEWAVWEEGFVYGCSSGRNRGGGSFF